MHAYPRPVFDTEFDEINFLVATPNFGCGIAMTRHPLTDPDVIICGPHPYRPPARRHSQTRQSVVFGAVQFWAHPGPPFPVDSDRVWKPSINVACWRSPRQRPGGQSAASCRVPEMPLEENSTRVRARPVAMPRLSGLPSRVGRREYGAAYDRELTRERPRDRGHIRLSSIQLR